MRKDRIDALQVEIDELQLYIADIEDRMLRAGLKDAQESIEAQADKIAKIVNTLLG